VEKAMRKRKQKKNFRRNFPLGSITESIESYIEGLVEEAGGTLVTTRKSIAEHLGCVPNHVSYVLKHRFTPDAGYLTSHGGSNFDAYIKVMKLRPRQCDDLSSKKLLEVIGNAITMDETRLLLNNLYRRGTLSHREMSAILTAALHQDITGDRDYELTAYRRDSMRAELLKSLLHTADFG